MLIDLIDLIEHRLRSQETAKLHFGKRECVTRMTRKC
jgi:hypothetical protein